ncbi:hypothetical protein QP157_11950 [Sphingomonas sp. LR61]
MHPTVCRGPWLTTGVVAASGADGGDGRSGTDAVGGPVDDRVAAE